MIQRREGYFDLAQGTITDKETGKVYTYSQWKVFTDTEYELALEKLINTTRDLTKDDQNLPGTKPYFHDDWIGKYPSRIKQHGLYPYELGYRSDVE